MLEIIRLTDRESLQLQESQGQYYFSRAADAVLRQYGILALESVGFCKPNRLNLVLRGVDLTVGDLSCASLVEGPLSAATADVCDVSPKADTATALWLRGDPSCLGSEYRSCFQVMYPEYDVRAIPREAGMAFGDVERFVSDDQLLKTPVINYQYFSELPAGWTPLLYVSSSHRMEDERLVAISNGICTLCTLPLVDLIAGNHHVQSLDRGYYSVPRSCDADRLQRLLLHILEFASYQTGMQILQVSIWPAGSRAAITIRHDYDRLITDRQLGKLLSFYENVGVKCTWCALPSRAPASQLEKLKRAGHEVALHSEASSENKFNSEVKSLEKLGFPVFGSTAHGGIGALGFVGDMQYRWQESAGFTYSEVLGSNSIVPHAAIGIDRGKVVVRSIVLPGVHLSLETSTSESDISIDHILEMAEYRVGRGGHINIMNHPDLCREELFESIRKMSLAGVWSATFMELAVWVFSSRLSVGVQCPIEGAVRLNFPQELPEPVRICLGGSLDPGRDDYYLPEREVKRIDSTFSGFVDIDLPELPAKMEIFALERR